ncbi:SpoIIIAH-like family protein [Solibacillus sp. FSL W7-1436]|uniref:SpoIIIAH-like family protein n=1 Tax=unclassified Solibacillus TaxID=2637870 RepID=UPI0030CCC7A5
MKVKKRTVWFLTVVSLAAVISVFYIFEDNTPNILTIFSDETIDETDILGVNQNLTQPVNSESDLFQEVRLELANKRSQQKEQLTQKIAADEFTAEEKNEAFNEMDELIKLESSEAMLEMLIKSIGYSDALVRIDGDKVAVRVMSDEVSEKLADEILYVVRSEFKDYVNVSVEFEPFN